MTTLSVPDMNCGHCKAAVEAALAPLAPLVSVDLTRREVTVTGAQDNGALLAALDAIGFPAQVISG